MPSLIQVTEACSPCSSSSRKNYAGSSPMNRASGKNAG
jgi:hypothetical protein